MSALAIPNKPASFIATTPAQIVLGQIIPPHRKNDPLMFFVAWWMDPKDL